MGLAAQPTHSVVQLTASTPILVLVPELDISVSWWLCNKYILNRYQVAVAKRHYRPLFAGFERRDCVRRHAGPLPTQL